ncbi:MAG TPA: LLM class flavin-dependent oxidoreductase [Ktedonobacteraceae bacterium]|nr:LLM class flavin-dependent oxidoreductase [Ktedonobacteraceae bacterium]
MQMKYGFIIPDGDTHSIPQLAVEAEAAGWDGVFIPDCIAIDTESTGPLPAYDPWILLGVIAARTEHIRFGTMLTPPSRRRPWKLARETVTLDRLSNGRLILPVGSGAAGDDAGFYKVGEEMDLKTRAQILDESLDILNGLWSGKPFSYDGEHYHVQQMTLLPAPIQSPRIPIWVVGAWPSMKSMRRVLRWDGLLPTKKDAANHPMTPDDIRAMKAFIDENRSLTTPFDIICEGETPGDDREQAASIVRPWAEAGATWWMEARWGNVSKEDVELRIRQGPPRIE